MWEIISNTERSTVAGEVELYFQTWERLAPWKPERREEVVAWAVRKSGEEHHGQKAQAVQRPWGQTLPMRLESSKETSGAGVEGAGKAVWEMQEASSGAESGPCPLAECLTGSEQPTSLISRPLGPAWYRVRWLAVTHPK